LNRKADRRTPQLCGKWEMGCRRNGNGSEGIGYWYWCVIKLSCFSYIGAPVFCIYLFTCTERLTSNVLRTTVCYAVCTDVYTVVLPVYVHQNCTVLDMPHTPRTPQA